MGVQALPVMLAKAGRVGTGLALPTETTGRSFPVGNASALAHGNWSTERPFRVMVTSFRGAVLSSHTYFLHCILVL